jgi:GMP synthase-like glutamine amidotransferase
MKTLCVLQHVEAEYLGLLEDHLESRAIRFRYVRPFTPDATIPHIAQGFDGLVILGAGPLGIVSGDLVPSLGPELRLARDFLARGLPVVGIGLGACLLAAAAGGGAEAAPLRFSIEHARRLVPAALGGHVPEQFPIAVYMRDRPVLPDGAETLAVTASGEAALFQLRGNCLGFLGHPGVKSGMIEDLILAFDETPQGSAETLVALRAAQAEMAGALSQLMIGLIKLTHLMPSTP